MKGPESKLSIYSIIDKTFSGVPLGLFEGF